MKTNGWRSRSRHVLNRHASDMAGTALTSQKDLMLQSLNRILTVLFVLAIILAAAAGWYLAKAMPIGTGYVAKYLCTSTFLSERDPQTVFVEIYTEETSRYVTILRNNAHLNITSMFSEYKNRAPDEDSVTVVSGLLGSYPNALWRVDASRLPRFAASLSSIENASDYERFVDEYGVRRTDPSFWQHSDALHAAWKLEAPIEYGILDFGRLENR